MKWYLSPFACLSSPPRHDSYYGLCLQYGQVHGSSPGTSTCLVGLPSPQMSFSHRHHAGHCAWQEEYFHAQVKGEDGTYLAWMVTGAFSCPLCFPAHSLTLLPTMQQQQSRENTTKIMSVLCSNLSGPLASLTVKAKSSQWLVGPTCIMGPPSLLRWHWWFWLRPSLSPSHMGFFYVL